MKKKLFSIILFLSFFLSTPVLLKATHIMGGEITYQNLGTNQYLVKLVLYRDCSGIQAVTTYQINISSASCGMYDSTFTVYQTSVAQISPICPGIVTACNGGAAVGVEKYEYENVINLPGNCPDYVFSYLECCRNNSITNLFISASAQARFEATLNNLSTPFNSSPVFTDDPIMFLYTGTLQTINNNATDPDGDSLVYSLAPALDTIGFVQYNPPYTYLNPISSSSPIVLDPQTGILSITPTGSERDVVSILISEYRNGTLIGTTTRDVQILVSGTTNQQPSLSGINGSSNFITHACAGDTVQFMLYSSDPDSSDSTTFSMSAPSGLSLTSFGAAQDSVLVEWITDSSMVSQIPYNLTIEVRDNKCPYNGSQAYNFPIYVNGCSSEIWPGDANSDLKCDIYDILPIGISYGASGPVRTSATTNWVAENSINWSQDFISGINLKHADCNGDGIINDADTLAIATNLGLTHPIRLVSPNFAQSSASMYLNADKDTVGAGQSVLLSIDLGSSSNPVTPIYGVAFVLNFNPILVDSSQSDLNYLSSNLGTPGTDLLTFAKTNWLAGKIYAAAVRTNQINSFSDGTIANFTVKIKNNIPVNTFGYFSLTGIRTINADGTIQTINAISDSVNINTLPVGIKRETETSKFHLFPNPAQNELFIVSDTKSEGSIMIHDMSGRRIIETTTNASYSTIDISLLPNGIYTVGIKTDEGLVWKKLIIQK